ncbi:metallophosphoesterase [Clostridium sp. SHJSY1]|uniref:metallophosphoesterase n=1 Tax=Clostridium sp. SHJSY1 TaxID=2942483 RepID=UPI0028747124|nr:metallophosphoesterase [Clostridium sp. SHJSY1]MDS0528154.1 metallophosphoesterase [Clostridium sp. SHJSY1]
MIKKIIRTLITVFLVLISFIAKIPKASVKSKFETLDDNVDIRFSVISDIHISLYKLQEIERLNEVFSTMYSLDPRMKAIAIVGDLTDNGFELEYNTVKSIIDKNKKSETELIASMGNHEGNTASLFKEITGKNPKENLIINGYHFITISPHSSEEEYGGSTYNLDEEWLKKQLDEATKENPKKPIFVFMHHGIKNTVCGTDLWNTNDLSEIFNNYPQVIHFSGHSHYPLNDPKSIYQNTFTALNTSTISYFELDQDMMYGSIPPNSRNASQMMVVEVEGSVVKIKRLDLLSRKYIGPDWIINTSKGVEDFKYTKDRKDKSKEPYFDKDNKLEINDVSNVTCQIKIGQAKIKEDDDIVYSYKYDFKNVKTGEIDKSYKISSEFYLIPTPEFIIQKFEGLNPNTQYEVIVTAYNAYGKRSYNKLSGIFQTENI